MASAVMLDGIRRAAALGHRSAGIPHILLALLDEAQPSVARDVLVSVGATREVAEQSASRAYQTAPADAEGRSSARSGPLWHETAARAEGLAAGFGDRSVTSEHILLALLWQPRDRWFEQILGRVGSSREALVAELAARGVSMPKVPLPDLGPPMTQCATFPRAHLDAVNWALREQAPDLRWGIGHDPDDEGVMVVLAAEHVDLSSILDEIVGRGGWTWRPPSADGRTDLTAE